MQPKGTGRYRETGRIDALVERSRRPLSSPKKVSEEVQAMVVAARKQRRWLRPPKLACGARGLRAVQGFRSHEEKKSAR